MKPTLEEIKQKYANAKEVICLYTEKIYDISDAEIRLSPNSYDKFEAYFKDEDDYCRLYKFGKYAEIISYKEEPLPIKKSTLLQLAENNSFSESIIKKEFPQLFEQPKQLTISEIEKILGYKILIKE